mmetsp:Transcript_105604/g.209829  ORF Transcript_105604/g.209829 Transcript_105604/m.209829 type:complete len:218 (+) Transcript_105604:53-706(+)
MVSTGHSTPLVGLTATGPADSIRAAAGGEGAVEDDMPATAEQAETAEEQALVLEWLTLRGAHSQVWEHREGTISEVELKLLLADAGLPEAHIAIVFERADLRSDGEGRIGCVDFASWLFSAAPLVLRRHVMEACHSWSRLDPETDEVASDHTAVHFPAECPAAEQERGLEDVAQELLDGMDLTATLPRPLPQVARRCAAEEEMGLLMDELGLSMGPC